MNVVPLILDKIKIIVIWKKTSVEEKNTMQIVVVSIETRKKQFFKDFGHFPKLP